MPSRAARWISAIVSRSKVADSRSPGCQAPGRWDPFVVALMSVDPDVVDGEVVELPRGAVAPELRGVGIDLGGGEQSEQLLVMLGAHLLFNAVGAEPGDRAADVQPRLVERVSERLAGVAAHHECPF